MTNKTNGINFSSDDISGTYADLLHFAKHYGVLIDRSYGTDLNDAMLFARSVLPFRSYWDFYNSTPSKKSWLQKIRGYDDLEARCKAAESMRDHNREMADMWEGVVDQYLKTTQGIILNSIDKNSNNGRRLKFSVGHNHITIIIGNPVTVCENFNPETNKDGKDTDTAYSICSPKDVYNWKTGAIKALENLCHDWGYHRQLTGDLFEAMKKRYPEVFQK